MNLPRSAQLLAEAANLCNRLRTEMNARAGEREEWRRLHSALRLAERRHQRRLTAFLARIEGRDGS